MFTFNDLPTNFQEQVKSVLCTQHVCWVYFCEDEMEYKIQYSACLHLGEYKEYLEIKSYEVMSYDEWKDGYKKEYGFAPYGADNYYYGNSRR